MEETAAVEQPRRRWLKLALKIAITVAVFAFISWKLEWERTWELLRQTNVLGLLGAVVAFAGSKWLAAQRLQHFWRAADIHITDAANVRLYMLAMFYNLLLPGGIGGDGYKVYELNKRFGVKVKVLASAVLLDRGNGLALLIVLALALSPLVQLPYGLANWLWTLIPVVMVGYYGVLRLLFGRFSKTFWITSLWSAGVQVGQAVTALCVLWALGQETQLMDYVFILLLSAIVLVVPIPSFGGLGLREMVMTFGASYLLIDTEISVAMSLLTYLAILIVSLAGMYFHFRTDRLFSPSK